MVKEISNNINKLQLTLILQIHNINLEVLE